MKIGTLNFCLLDMSEAEECEIDTSKLPSLEQFVSYIKAHLEEMKNTGVTEVKEMNVTLIDLSEAEKINVK